MSRICQPLTDIAGDLFSVCCSQSLVPHMYQVNISSILSDNCVPVIYSWYLITRSHMATALWRERKGDCVLSAQVIYMLQLPPQSGQGPLQSPCPVWGTHVAIRFVTSQPARTHYCAPYHYTGNHELCLLCISRRKVCQHTYFEVNQLWVRAR